MLRQDVYDKCVEIIYPTLGVHEDGIYSVKQLLPPEAIDAIIDCAVEEAILALKGENKDEQLS